MAAEYVMTTSPGAGLPGVGWVRCGETFRAPYPEYVPSVTFYPMNEEGLVGLTSAFDARRELLQDRLAYCSPEDKTKIHGELAELAQRRARALRIVTRDELGDFRSKGPVHFHRNRRTS